MKKVLLLGDSIRLGYQPFVKEALDGIADVVGSQDNGRFAKYTLWSLELVIKEFGNPDVVHWNNGFWDVHHVALNEGALTPTNEYIETLRRIIGQLKKTGAKIIFANMTPISSAAQGKNNEEIRRYNATAAALMADCGIEVNDLNSLISTNIENYVCEDGLHLTELGNKVCAEQVSAKIRNILDIN